MLSIRKTYRCSYCNYSADFFTQAECPGCNLAMVFGNETPPEAEFTRMRVVAAELPPPGRFVQVWLPLLNEDRLSPASALVTAVRQQKIYVTIFYPLDGLRHTFILADNYSEEPQRGYWCWPPEL